VPILDVCAVLPRDAMRKRGTCCRSVSVRLSACHTRVLYPNGFELLSQPGCSNILVFLTSSAVAHFLEDPLSGGV